MTPGSMENSSVMPSTNGAYQEDAEADRRRTAIHEAGHAVVAVAVGVGIKRISIVRDPERRRKGSFLCDEDHLTSPRQQAIIAIAGVHAERIAFKNHHEPGAKADLRNHHMAVDMMNHEATEVEYQSLMKEIQDEAKSILNGYWIAVQALAEALLEQEELQEDEVRIILARCGLTLEPR